MATTDLDLLREEVAALRETVHQLYDQLRRLGPDMTPGATTAGPGARPCFAEIAVERIDIVEPDGTLRLAISNAARCPDPVIDGRTFAGVRDGGKQAGLMFYNEEGDECGGLIYHGKREDGHYAAEAGLMFDQFKQDQVVALQHSDEDGQRTAGLTVWDRMDTPLTELIDRWQAAERLPEGVEREQALARVDELGPTNARRVFVGKTKEGTAIVDLRDAANRTRLRLSVEAAGTPRLEFLDEDGQVIGTIPPGADQ